MEVLLLGTGSADGWPNPFCSCRSCTAALAAGDVRGQTAALLDGRLLLDCGPEAPRAALRHGRSLAGVRHLLLTHSHPDHVGPAALLFRAWAQRGEPLDVVGPAAALAASRDWVGPDDPVRFRPVEAGDRVDLSGYAVVVLAAAHGDEHSGPGVLYDVTGPDGSRLLYATDTAALPPQTLAAVTGRDYHAVLLEECFGDRHDHGTDHLDLATFPAQVDQLRTAGAVGAGTAVVAVHLSHHNPPAPELAARLAACGARLLPDGSVLDLPSRGSGGGRRVLVLGGARSGKSAFAEARLAGRGGVTYVATGGVRPDDAEWAARVALHRARRPPDWRTVETTDLGPLLRAAPAGTSLLVDCVGLWLTAVLDDATGDGVGRRVDDLVAAVRATAADVVLVSNEVGAGVVPASASGRVFRDELGRLNARLAAVADEVVLVVAGLPLPLRPPAGGAR